MGFHEHCYRYILSINELLALPAMVVFFGVALILTLKAGFPQLRAFPRFVKLLIQGISEKKDATKKTIGPFQALFTAMATTIGAGNIVGPSMAVVMGGPGALFWLVVYIFFGSVTKFTEVTFSVHARTASDRGDIIGGPTQYLRLVSPFLGVWYAALTILLFTVWSSIQVNTIACIGSREGVEPWLTGLVVVFILLAVVFGGVKRIGAVMSKLVPFMFITYVVSAAFILFKHSSLFYGTIQLIFDSAFSSQAAVGGVAGITFFVAIREGVYKAIFITEAGTGTSSFAHSLSDAANPSDQGVLAMFSGIADIFLCVLSGLLVLVTGIWKTDLPGNTLIYEVFKINMPGGHYVLLLAIFLFVVTTLIGNTFNGSQSFASFTKYRYVNFYFMFAAAVAYSGALVSMPVLWSFMDIVLALVAIPNLIGLLILAFKYSSVLKIK